MDLKALLDYGRGLEVSDKQAKGIEEQEKLAKVAEVQAVREESQSRKTGSVTGVEKITLIKDDLNLSSTE